MAGAFSDPNNRVLKLRAWRLWHLPPHLKAATCGSQFLPASQLPEKQAAAKRYRINTEKIAEDVAGEFAAKRKKQEKKRKADGIGTAKKERAKGVAGASA